MALKLMLDKDDYRSLKPLLALKISGRALEVKVQDVDTFADAALHHLQLPRLETSEDSRSLFSENAIVSYFLPPKTSEQSLAVNLWLEWESIHLQPNVSALVTQVWGGAKAKPQSISVINSLFDYLNKSLSGKVYLVEGVLTAADVVVWVTLLPVAGKAEGPSAELKDYGNVIDWFRRLSALPTFSETIDRATSLRGIQAFKNSFLNNRFLRHNIAEQAASSHIQTSSPAHHGTETASADNEDAEEVVSPAEIEAAFEKWCNGRDQLQAPRVTQKPILPIPGGRNVLITSALPYVNNVPHLGNIIGCVLSADVFARYCRLRNYTTLFLCGTDEYGTATETKALEEGCTPQQICDKYNKIHTDVYQWFQISFDHFGRTTTPQQTEIAQDIFWKLHKNGYLLEDTMEQLLCTQCNRFLADRFVEGNCPYCDYEDARGDQCDKCGKLVNAIDLKSPRCKVCRAAPVQKTSRHLFLDLPKLESKIVSWLDEAVRTGVWSTSARVIARTWLKDGLKPRCITRDLKWGTPVPLDGFKDKVFYVWYDAPIGYLSIAANYTDQWQQWFKNPNDVRLYQFMAKDNVPFHSIIFPACEIGSGDNYTIVGSLSAVEYLNYEDGKFSKSRGVGVFGNDAKETGIPSDIWRFYLLYLRPENQDTAFSWNDLMMKNNTELLNNLGNFINRASMFLANSFNGVMPDMNLGEEEKRLLALVNRQLSTFLTLLETTKLRDAIKPIFNISRLGNQHMQSQQPWVLAKGTPQEKERAGTVIGFCVNVACLLALMLEPFMPTTSETIRQQLNIPADVRILPQNVVRFLPPGHRIGKPSPLFQKIETAQVELFRKKFAGNQSSRENSPHENSVQNGMAAKPKVQVVANSPDKSTNSKDKDPKRIAELLAAVNEQGNRVRVLKTQKASKEDVDKEVAELLKLKKLLTLAGGEVAQPAGNTSGNSKVQVVANSPDKSTDSKDKDPKLIAELLAAVNEQGNRVRVLKTQKASKEDVDKEVAELLKLKKLLTLAGGEVAQPAGKTSGKKKGKAK